MLSSSENVNDCIKSVYKLTCHEATCCDIPEKGIWRASTHYQQHSATLKIAPIAEHSPNMELTRRCEAICDLKLVYDENYKPLAIWRELVSGRSQLFYSSFSGSRWTEATLIPAPEGQMGHFSVQNSCNNIPWIALESTASGKRHIFVSWWSDGQWAFAQRISDGDGHCFRPALCRFGDGIRAVWEACVDNSYTIFMRELDSNPELPKRENQAIVATSDTLLANVTIASLDEESSIVIWEKAQSDWGKKNHVFRASREKMSDGNFLMARRTLHGAVISPEGIATLSGDMNASFDEYEYAAVRTQPHLASGPDGSLWLSFRQIVNLPEAGRHRGFHQLLTNYQGGKWSQPLVVPNSSGDCDLEASFSTGSKGVILNWMERGGSRDVSRDGTRDKTPTIAPKAQFISHAAELPPTGHCGKITTKKFRTMKVPDLDNAKASAIRWMDAPYTSRRLLWGDLHRHTSLSGCRWWCEGSPEDAYRYAIQAAKLDFMALTDHGWDLNSADTRRRLFDAAATFNTLGLFTAICAYEMSIGGGDGHMVVLTTESDPALPEAKTRKELYTALAGTDVLIVPHHMGDPDYPYVWKGHRDDLSPLAEIYQPYRTAFEQKDAPTPKTAWIEEGNRPLDEGMLIEAWRAGLKIGVVASSDHLSTSGAYAGVWATANTRRSIIDALRQRCCYAATAKIELDFRCDGRPMGAIFKSESKKLNFSFDCRGAGKLAKVEFLAAGEVIKSFKPKSGGKKLSEKFKLNAPDSEQFYYLRVIQQNGEMAWSSPIWVTGE